MKKIILYLIFLLFCSTFTGNAQNEQVIDASKATNFYSYLNNTFEFVSRENSGNLIGYRANITFSPSERHLFLGEVPLQYNLQKSKIGFGDIRVRYFFLPYKNYANFMGAFGPSVQMSLGYTVFF